MLHPVHAPRSPATASPVSKRMRVEKRLRARSPGEEYALDSSERVPRVEPAPVAVMATAPMMNAVGQVNFYQVASGAPAVLQQSVVQPAVIQSAVIQPTSAIGFLQYLNSIPTEEIKHLRVFS